MSRLKNEILNKLKEYAGKMGRDHLGGDDYTSKKRGGLRDFDGYDNVDYNQDMPMDEATMRPSQIRSAISKVKKQLMRKWKQKGGYENFGQKELDKMKSKFDYNPYGSSDERQISKMLDGFDNWAMNYDGNMRESVTEAKLNHYRITGNSIEFYVKDKGKNLVLRFKDKRDFDKLKLDLDNPKDLQKILAKRPNKMSISMGESVNEVGKGSNWAEKYVNDTNLYKKLNWYMKMGKGAEKKIKGKEFVIMSDGSALIWNTKTSDWKLYKPKRIDKKTGKPIYESVNEAKVNYNFSENELKRVLKLLGRNASTEVKMIKAFEKAFGRKLTRDELFESINEVGVNVWYIYKKANKNKNKFFNMLSDFRKKHSDTAWIKMLNYALEDFNENPKKYKTIDDKQNILFKNLQNKKKVYEGMFSTIDQIRQDSKNVRDFVKNVFKDREFKKMSNDKDFIKYLKSIYEGVNEDGHPQNWMSGRTSDYHTALRGKNKDYSGGTNFKKKNHGQPDVEEDDEDQETNHLSNKQLHVKAKLKVAESGKKKSDKNYKDWKNTNEGFDKIEHLSLLNKALRAIPGSPKQKDIIRKLNKVRKAGGMKPLKEQSIVEYASRLTLSYIADKDSKLDGTPEDIKAIDEKAERDYKDEYKKFQSSKKSKKYRAELNKYNRQKGTYGNGDGKDASHKGGKIVGFEAQSKNRGRREKSRLKKESVVNEVGQFPVTNYIKGIIPQGRLDTNTPQNKKKSVKLVKDLKNTLNNFWKSHDIPYRIR